MSKIANNPIGGQPDNPEQYFSLSQSPDTFYNEELCRLLEQTAKSATHRIRQQREELGRLEKENKGLRAEVEELRVKIYELKMRRDFTPPSAAFQDDAKESFINKKGQDNDNFQ